MVLNPDRLINLKINRKEENKHYLIWRLRIRGDHELILIFTILKFSALYTVNLAYSGGDSSGVQSRFP